MTAAALRNELKSLLTRAGVENPAGDAELILSRVLGYNHVALLLHRDDDVPQSACEEALTMAKKRAQGAPIQYVLGSWSFMGRDYAVGEGVLIPRDDTEVVVRAALERMKGVPSPAVLDLCAGSGIIAITLDRELTDARVTAVEKSELAYAYLLRNAQDLRANVSAVCADLCDCPDRFDDASLDLIISNPPYIPTAELPTLQKEVRFEPEMALDGGADGTDFYHLIVRLWTPKLKQGGVIAFELGEDQFGEVADLLTRYGYTDVRGYEDIQGTIRAVTASH